MSLLRKKKGNVLIYGYVDIHIYMYMHRISERKCESDNNGGYLWEVRIGRLGSKRLLFNSISFIVFVEFFSKINI